MSIAKKVPFNANQVIGNQSRNKPSSVSSASGAKFKNPTTTNSSNAAKVFKDYPNVTVKSGVKTFVTKGEYPTEEEMDEIIHRFVENEHSAGFDPKKLALKDVIMVSNFFISLS